MSVSHRKHDYFIYKTAVSLMVEVNRVVAEETYDQPQAVSGTTDNPLNAPYAGTSIIYVYSILYIRIPESMSVS